MKTIEEAAKDITYSQCKFSMKNPHCKSIDSSNCDTCGFGNHIYSGSIKMAKFAQRWISVEEEMPDQGELVLIKFNVAETKAQIAEIGVVITGYYLETKLFDIEQQSGIVVTHWRPIELK